MIHDSNAVNKQHFQDPCVHSRCEAIFCRLTKLWVLTEIMNASDFSQHAPHIIQTYAWIISDLVAEVEVSFRVLWEEY